MYRYWVWRPSEGPALHQHVHTCIVSCGNEDCSCHSDSDRITLHRLRVDLHPDFCFSDDFTVTAIYIPDTIYMDLSFVPTELPPLPSVTLPKTVLPVLPTVPSVQLPTFTHNACNCIPIDLEYANVTCDTYYIQGNYYTRIELQYRCPLLDIRLCSQLDLSDSDPTIYFETVV